jgi:hypothetical protein
MRVPAVGQRRGGAEEEWLRRRDYGSETVTTHRDLAFLPEDGTGVTGRVWGGARRPEVGQVACRMHGTHVQACGARRVAPGRYVLLRELGAWKKREAEGPQGVRSTATLPASLSIPFMHLRKCHTPKSDN